MSAIAKNENLFQAFENRFGKEVTAFLRGVEPLSSDFDESSYDIPYILELSSKNQRFVYFGLNHFEELQSKEVEVLKSLFLDFAALGKKSVLALEFLGRHKDISLLASHNKMIVICPDVTSAEISDAIKESGKFTLRQIGSWIFVNALWGISSLGTNEVSDSKINNLLKQLKEDFGIYSVDDINQELSYSTTLNLEFPLGINSSNLPDRNLLRSAQSAFCDYGILNQIGREMNYVRDLFIAANLIKVLLQGKSVFAIYGLNHVVLQEPAFKKLFERLR